MRNRKRNNFTLSEEAQKIVDKIPSYKKSRFVSEAIVSKNSFCEHEYKPYPIDDFQHNYEMRCSKCLQRPNQTIGTIPSNRKIID